MIIKNKISIFFCFTDDSVEIFSFILLCHKERVKKAVSTLQLYGKMSLTNYITQSVVGTVIYFPFVFYLAPYYEYVASYLSNSASLRVKYGFANGDKIKRIAVSSKTAHTAILHLSS